MSDSVSAAVKDAIAPAEPLRLDFGCGVNKRAVDLKGQPAAWKGVDQYDFTGVDFVMDVRQAPWQWATESVDEAASSHFVEHLTGLERITFFNELYRVLKFGSSAVITVPSWSHDCAYGDPTHQWPPMSGWSVLYLTKHWRVGGPNPQNPQIIDPGNAPHCDLEATKGAFGYSCDFDWASSGTWDPWLETRAEKLFPMQRYVNSTRDLIFTLSKTKRT